MKKGLNTECITFTAKLCWFLVNLIFRHKWTLIIKLCADESIFLVIRYNYVDFSENRCVFVQISAISSTLSTNRIHVLHSHTQWRTYGMVVVVFFILSWNFWYGCLCFIAFYVYFYLHFVKYMLFFSICQCACMCGFMWVRDNVFHSAFQMRHTDEPHSSIFLLIL